MTTSSHVRDLCHRAAGTVGGLVVTWPDADLGPQEAADQSRRFQRVYTALCAKEPGLRALSLSRRHTAQGWTVSIESSAGAPFSGTVTEAKSGAEIPDFIPEALEAARLADYLQWAVQRYGTDTCPLDPAQQLAFWRARPDQAAELWQEFGWPVPLTIKQRKTAT